jgi:diacylglycerol O-acyltransferase / wax synthase
MTHRHARWIILKYSTSRFSLLPAAGTRVVGMHDVAPLVENCGLNIIATARGEVLDLTVCACPDNVPAVDDIATGIAESVDVLAAAAQESPRGQGRSVVTRMTSHATKRSPTWHR